MEDFWLDRWLLGRFRAFHTSSFGRLSAAQGYAGLIEEVREGLRTHSPEDFGRRVHQTFRGFFTPAGAALSRLLAQGAPGLSRALFVQATPPAFRFLVGESRAVAPDQVRIVRCKFAEQAGAEACIKACKLPTEAFFREELGLALRLEPDHATLCCTARFAPLAESERPLQS